MNTKHHHIEAVGDSASLPAGLVDENVELFSDNGFLKGTHKGQTLLFEALPDKIKLYFASLYQIELRLNHNLEKELNKRFGCKTYEQDLQQFIICNYGGFDNNPDFNHISEPKKEYWDCGHRGTCETEGIICKPDCIAESNLSIRETQVIKYVSHGLQDIEIADKLKLAISTITTHLKNIRKKLNVNNRGEIIRFAFKNNIAL